MKKNIWKSILITNFVVMILISAYLYISQSIEKVHLAKEDNDTKTMYIDSAKSFEDSFAEKTGDERLYEEGLTLHLMLYKSYQSVVVLEVSAIILSIIMGIAIGYIITVTNSNQDKKIIMKKLLVAYISGILLILILSILSTTIFYKSLDILTILKTIETPSIVWTLVFIATLLVKRFSDNKKAKELKDALDLTRK